LTHLDESNVPRDIGLSAIRKFRISLIAGPSRTGLRFQAGGEHAFGMEDVKKSVAATDPQPI
jgi:hypothetical protein